MRFRIACISPPPLQTPNPELPNALPPPPPSDEIVFTPGVVELSILLGVHEDGEVETDEHFDLFLYEPWGGARLGSQQRTRVTILDAESNGTVTHHSESALFYPESSDDYDGDDDEEEEEETADDDDVVVVDVVAGTLENATIVAKDALGGLRGFGGDVFDAWVEVRGEQEEVIYGNTAILDGINFSSYSSSVVGIRSTAAAAAVTRVEDLGSGNYTLSYQVSSIDKIGPFTTNCNCICI